jgi:hypothetical protein
MTDSEFKAALKRRGWSWVMGWVHIPKQDGHGSLGVGCVIKRSGGKWVADKRATLAKAIRMADEEAAAFSGILTTAERDAA